MLTLNNILWINNVMESMEKGTTAKWPQGTWFLKGLYGNSVGVAAVEVEVCHHM